jgi:hypothetical protein
MVSNLGVVHLSAAGSLLLFAVWERVLHALISLVGRGDPKSRSGIRGYAGIQVLGSVVMLVVRLVTSGAQSAVSGAVGVLGYLFWVFVLSVMFAGMYLVQEYYPDMLWSAVVYWNEVLGPMFDAVVMVPLAVVDTLVTSLVPVWNWGCFIFTRLFYELVVVSAIRDFPLFQSLAGNVTALVSHSVQSVTGYVEDLSVGCDGNLDICYDPGRRTLDLLTPMGDVRGIVGVMGVLLTRMCSITSAPIAMGLYPFLDVNLAKGVHNLVNSVLYTLFHIPLVTVLRCGQGGGNVVLCLPDFEPSFNFLLAGLRSTGQLIDNWVNMCMVIAEVELTGSSEVSTVPKNPIVYTYT